MTPLRILIADDHPVFRFGLRALISAEEEMEVVGEATTGEETVALAERLQPNVVLMDLNLPDFNGIEATRRILSQSPSIGVLVITMFDDESVFGAMRVGARGYILKGAQGEETVRAIRAAGSGEAIFSPSIAERLLRHFAEPSAASREQPFPHLTDREREVLHFIAQGLTNTAIAERLYLSPKTVRNQVSSIFSKLQVEDRAQAIIRAREAGLGRDDH